jgi:hypothetical protein
LLHEVKGIARTMMVGQSKAHGRVELARFPDGSWTIRKDGPTVGIWEPHEQAECLRVFGMLTGLDMPPAAGDGPNVVLFVRRQTGTPQWN